MHSHGWPLALFVVCSSAGASVPQVTVTLTGPSVVWANDRAVFRATGLVTLDLETAGLSPDARVYTGYSWRYAPARLAASSSGGTTRTLRYSPHASGVSNLVTVTFSARAVYPDGRVQRWSASAERAVTVKAESGRFVPQQTHDYIVPHSGLNTIAYTIAARAGRMAFVGVQVRNRHHAVVRRLQGTPVTAKQYIRWDGLDRHGKPLTEAEAPYSYVLKATTREGRSYEDKLGQRLLHVVPLSIVIPDLAYPGSTYESGVNEDTLADEAGRPRNIHVRVKVTAGQDYTIPFYRVVPDTGKNKWDADLHLLDQSRRPFLFYTTPDPRIPPLIRYTMIMWQTPPYVQDEARNEWDMDDRTNKKETEAMWQFGLTPKGENRDFTERYR